MSAARSSPLCNNRKYRLTLAFLCPLLLRFNQVGMNIAFFFQQPCKFLGELARFGDVCSAFFAVDTGTSICSISQMWEMSSSTASSRGLSSSEEAAELPDLAEPGRGGVARDLRPSGERERLWSVTSTGLLTGDDSTASRGDSGGVCNSAHHHVRGRLLETAHNVDFALRSRLHANVPLLRCAIASVLLGRFPLQMNLSDLSHDIVQLSVAHVTALSKHFEQRGNAPLRASEHLLTSATPAQAAGRAGCLRIHRRSCR